MDYLIGVGILIIYTIYRDWRFYKYHHNNKRGGTSQVYHLFYYCGRGPGLLFLAGWFTGFLDNGGHFDNVFLTSALTNTEGFLYCRFAVKFLGLFLGQYSKGHDSQLYFQNEQLIYPPHSPPHYIS